MIPGLSMDVNLFLSDEHFSSNVFFELLNGSEIGPTPGLILATLDTPNIKSNIASK